MTEGKYIAVEVPEGKDIAASVLNVPQTVNLHYYMFSSLQFYQLSPIHRALTWSSD